MRLAQVIGIAIALVLFTGGVYTSYEKSRNLNEATCLGCLALNPIVKSFSGFWVEYPEGYDKEGNNVPHPSWVVDELSKGKVVMLFFWYHGCDPCSRQWSDMKNAGIVEGSEENGCMDERYKKNITLFTVDIINSERKDVIKIYTPKGDIGAPTTVILTLKDGNVLWYAFQGPAGGDGGQPSLKQLEEILALAVENMEV
ncbi:MAG: hypothetical protein U9O96_03885 [Candidatus Thermoplasmatota archaeon]|nr:hypothetical protein [Candidatus Thermoplasmatota archaeon]